MSQKRRVQRYRGITLVDVLLALMLLGVFTLIASRLIFSNFNVTSNTLAADQNSSRFGQAMSLLRADVSAASNIESPGVNSIRTRGDAAQIIDWKVDRNTLWRTVGTQHQTWDLGQPIQLNLDQSIVLVQTRTDTLAMASPRFGAIR